jgi:predicted signal transduction protein with EAL and GGDEF domain
MNFHFRGVDEMYKFHHGTCCRLRLPPQARDGEVPSIRKLPAMSLNTLKIDRSFICTVTSDRFCTGLVKAIISIAKRLGQCVVAEGVETEEQAAFLQTHGCQIAQGYLYSKPVNKTAFELLSQSFALAQRGHGYMGNECFAVED